MSISKTYHLTTIILLPEKEENDIVETLLETILCNEIVTTLNIFTVN